MKATDEQPDLGRAHRSGGRYRLALRVCVGIAAVLAMAGCMGSGSESSTAQRSGSLEKVDMAAELKKPAELTFWTWVPGIEEEVALFERAYPNIEVEVVNVGVGVEQYQKLRTVLRSGRGVPDVVQMEFQYLPSFTVTKSLLDLAPYLPDGFGARYPDWVTGQVVAGERVWAVPQDTGPMGMLYRKDLLDRAGIEAPRTWAEFAAAAREYRRKNPDSYLTNMPGNEPPQWLGLFWQAGARPFARLSEDELKINLTDPAAEKVADFWTELIQEDVIATDPGFTDQWYQGLARGKYAAWLAGAWGPAFLQSTAGNTAGKWRAAPLPQWSDGAPVSANWGGSTDAVLATTEHPAAAAELARWINQEREPALQLATERFLFPASHAILEDPRWLDQRSAFYGGQRVNRLFSEINATVAKDWEWSPVHDFVVSDGSETFGRAVSRREDLVAALGSWQRAVADYAKSQGFKVVG